MILALQIQIPTNITPFLIELNHELHWGDDICYVLTFFKKLELICVFYIYSIVLISLSRSLYIRIF